LRDLHVFGIPGYDRVDLYTGTPPPPTRITGTVHQISFNIFGIQEYIYHEPEHSPSKNWGSSDEHQNIKWLFS
jgi:hypothetical protein